MFDTIIRAGTIVDGSGQPGFTGDVAIANGMIAEVGQISGFARREIDADGLMVTPGFVDIHTHYDGQATWDSMLAPSSLHGVTSLAMGNCGVGFAPARAEKHDWLIALLEGVEDIPGTALTEGMTWGWESFPEYLDILASKAFALDVGAHLPHAALRAYVMGDRGGDHEAVPTDQEIDTMRQLAVQALEAGALGFSTSRTAFHKSSDGENIGTLSAGARELTGIVRALAQTGKGVVQLISDAYLTTDAEFAQSELDLIESLSRTSGRPLSFTVQQTDQAPGRWREIFRWLDHKAGEGLDLKAQVAPRPIGLIFGHSITLNPFILTDTYRRLSSLPLPQKISALAADATRDAILAEHRALKLDGLTEGAARGFARMFRMTDPVDYEPDVSTSLAAEASARSMDPAAYAYDVFLEEEGNRLIYQPLINYARGDLGDVHGMMTGGHILYGLSDGGAHCGTICDASFPTTTIALWSRGNKKGLRIPIETLVHGYTRRNAAHVGWFDRGLLAPGMLADINIIDIDSLTVAPPVVVRDLPAGGSRLMQHARGYVATLKSGLVTVENDVATGDLPGRLLRGVQGRA